jgi:hypothetical protein
MPKTAVLTGAFMLTGPTEEEGKCSQKSYIAKSAMTS